jgi:hypothetical protein
MGLPSTRNSWVGVLSKDKKFQRIFWPCLLRTTTTTKVRMLLRVILDIAPYFAIAALSLGILMAWILKAGPPAGNSPLSKVSAGFLVGLVATLFVAFLPVSVNSIIENSRIRQTIAMQQSLLAKAAAEQKLLEKNAAKLKLEIGELRAQKALYTATIETLAKK